MGALGSTYNMYMGCFYMPILWKYKGDGYQLIKHWLLPGIYMVIISYPLSYSIPYNRKIWTPTFALLSSGCFGFILSFFFLVFDRMKNPVSEIIKLPFIYLGSNILFIYSGMVVVNNFLRHNVSFTAEDGTITSLWSILYNDILMSIVPN